MENLQCYDDLQNGNCQYDYAGNECYGAQPIHVVMEIKNISTLWCKYLKCEQFVHFCSGFFIFSTTRMKSSDLIFVLFCVVALNPWVK